MVTDYYRKVYSQKLDHKGESLKDVAVSRGVQEFERYLATAPTRQTVKRLIPPDFINGKSINVSIQRSHQNLVADRYEKDILGSLQDNLKIGDIFEWEDDNWIVMTQNKLSIPSHFKGKIRLCNHFLKWNIQGIVYMVPGHVITSRAFALEEGQKAGLTWDEQAMVVLAILPSNDITNTITRYHRFIIKQQAWKVVSTDNLSVDNLLFVRLEEDQINLATDDLENGIADKYIPIPDTEETIEGAVYTIDGAHKLVWNQKDEYKGYQDGVLDEDATFSVTESDMGIVIEQGNPAVIRANSQGLVGNMIIQCHFSSGQTIEKVVEITGLWG